MEDNDLMPFGVHKGKEMANVPSHYLLWLYEEKKCSGQVKQYIIDNLDVIHSDIKRNNIIENKNE